jgi:hypothetical protein
MSVHMLVRVERGERETNADRHFIAGHQRGEQRFSRCALDLGDGQGGGTIWGRDRSASGDVLRSTGSLCMPPRTAVESRILAFFRRLLVPGTFTISFFIVSS